MKILAVTFDYGSQTTYDKLARVLEFSASKNCPTAEFTLLRIPAPKVQREKKCFDSNNVKMHHWVDFIDSANDDVVLMDCDMVIMHDISVAFKEKFDIGLSQRNKGTLPWNGGVVFVRNNARARAFMHAWKDADDALFADPKLHYKWRKQFGGMNQASLGLLLHQKKDIATIHPFPCQIWNSVLEYWAKIDINKTMILHVKSGLRADVIANRRYRWVQACDIWYSYAKHCGIQTPYTGNLNLFQYQDYGQYVKAQKKAAVEKKDFVWAEKQSLALLAKVLLKRIRPVFGICHGTRNGAEQSYFKGLFPGCSIIGTEIADFAKTIPNTVQHDFNLQRDEWIGKADFVYSNAFDHAFDPEKTLKVWLAQLNHNGILIIEHSNKHMKPPTESDPFSFDSAQMSAMVHEWTKSRYRVATIITTPMITVKPKNYRVHDTRFIIIERSLTSGEQLEAARRKALGYS